MFGLTLDTKYKLSNFYIIGYKNIKAPAFIE